MCMDTMKGEKLKESESRSTVFVKRKKEKGLESTPGPDGLADLKAVWT